MKQDYLQDNKSKKTVIYIDDSLDALELAEAIVAGDSRFNLITVDNKEKLADVLTTIVPDAIIFDMNLGNDLTGTVLASKIRKDYPQLPIAIYSSYEKDRVEVLVGYLGDEKGGLTVWQKSDVGVSNLADEINKLLE